MQPTFDEAMREAQRTSKRKRGTKPLTVTQEIKRHEAAEIAKRDFLFEEFEWLSARLRNGLCESDTEEAQDKQRLCEVCLELGVKIPTELVKPKIKKIEFKTKNQFKFSFVVGQGVLINE